MTVNNLEKSNLENSKKETNNISPIEENKILPVDENKDFPVAINNVNKKDLPLSAGENIEKENITGENTEKKEKDEKVAGEFILEKEETTILTEAEQIVSQEAKEGDLISKKETQINFEELSAKLKETRESFAKEKFDFYQNLLKRVKNLSNEDKEELANLVHEFCLFNEITDPDEIDLISDRDGLLKNIQFNYKEAYDQYKAKDQTEQELAKNYQEIVKFVSDWQSKGIDSFEKLSNDEKNNFLKKYKQFFSSLDQDNPVKEKLDNLLSQFFNLQAGESASDYIFQEIAINDNNKWESLHDNNEKKRFLESYIQIVSRQPENFLFYKRVFKKFFPLNNTTISNNEELVTETKKEIDNLDEKNFALESYQEHFSKFSPDIQEKYGLNFDELMATRRSLEEKYINAPIEEQNEIYQELIEVDQTINDFFLMLETGESSETVTNEEQKILDFQERFFSWPKEIQTKYQEEYEKLIKEYTTLVLLEDKPKKRKEKKEKQQLIKNGEEKIENLFSSIEKRFQTTDFDKKLLEIDFRQYFSNIEKLDEQKLTDLFELLAERDDIISQGQKKIVKDFDYYEGKMNEEKIFSRKLDKYLRILYENISITDENRTELIDSLRKYLIEIDNFSKLCQEEKELSDKQKKIDPEKYFLQEQELLEKINSYLAVFSLPSKGKINTFLSKKNTLSTDSDLRTNVSDTYQKRVDHIFGRDQEKFTVNIGDYLAEFGEIKNKISSHEISFTDAKNVYSEIAHRLIADAGKSGCDFATGISELDKLYITFKFLQKSTKNKYEKERLKEILKNVYVDFDLQEKNSVEENFKDLLAGIEKAQNDFSRDILTMKGMDERLNFYANEIKTMAKNLNINIEDQTISSLLNSLAEESGMNLTEIKEIKKLYENFSVAEIKKETQELINKITQEEKKIDPTSKRAKIGRQILSVIQKPMTPGLTGGSVGFSLFRWAFKFLDHTIFNSFIGNGLKSLFGADKR